MTLIVGILCKDGIVLGADGAASLGGLGQSTVRQPVKKLSLIPPPYPTIVGVSGSVGLSQRIVSTFSKMHNGRQLSGKMLPTDAMAVIRNQIWKDCIQPEFNVAIEAQKLIPNLAQRSALCASMVALPIDKKFCLFQFDQQASPEMATENLPFISIGSGQQGADPFLSFMRRIFWPARLPNLAEGIFATYWTLDHAIKTSPGGVAEPIQIAVLENKNDVMISRELDQNDLLAHEEAITNAERHLSGFNVTPKDPQQIPTPTAHPPS